MVLTQPAAISRSGVLLDLALEIETADSAKAIAFIITRLQSCSRCLTSKTFERFFEVKFTHLRTREVTFSVMASIERSAVIVIHASAICEEEKNQVMLIGEWLSKRFKHVFF